MKKSISMLITAGVLVSCIGCSNNTTGLSGKDISISEDVSSIEGVNTSEEVPTVEVESSVTKVEDPTQFTIEEISALDRVSEEDIGFELNWSDDETVHTEYFNHWYIIDAVEPYEFDDDNSTYKSFYGYTYKFINEEEYDKCGPYNNVSLIAYLTGYDEDYMLIFENCAFLEEHHEEYTYTDDSDSGSVGDYINPGETVYTCTADELVANYDRYKLLYGNCLFYVTGLNTEYKTNTENIETSGSLTIYSPNRIDFGTIMGSYQDYNVYGYLKDSPLGGPGIQATEIEILD